MNDEVHISSLVVQAKPQNLDDIENAIQELENAEIYLKDKLGKLIVVLETKTSFELSEQMTFIQNLPNVLGASLIYHQIDQGINFNEDITQGRQI